MNGISSRPNQPSMRILVCGYERGGTTLLSDILRANGFESGFECGVLLADRPSRFRECKPYYDMLLAGWRISTSDRKSMLKGDFKDFYQSLTSAAFPDFDGRGFFDKTPAYMERLGLCLNRAPFIDKAIVIYRDPRALFCSWAARISPDRDLTLVIKDNIAQFSDRYISYFTGSIFHVSNSRVQFVPFERLVLNEEMWLQNIGVFIDGEVFSPRKKKSRFGNVYSNEMRSDKVQPFKVLSHDLQVEILSRTQIASPFFSLDDVTCEYGDLWKRTSNEIRRRIERYSLPANGMMLDDVYFEPSSYLLRYPDVLKAGVSPVDHFLQNGRKEGRRPA